MLACAWTPAKSSAVSSQGLKSSFIHPRQARVASSFVEGRSPDARVGKTNFVVCRLDLASAEPLASLSPWTYHSDAIASPARRSIRRFGSSRRPQTAMITTTPQFRSSVVNASRSRSPTARSLNLP
jgi:hypothetical protein